MKFGHPLLSVLLSCMFAAPAFAAVPLYSVTTVTDRGAWRLIDNAGTLYGSSGGRAAYYAEGVAHQLGIDSGPGASGAVLSVSRAGHIASYEYWTLYTDYPNAYAYLTVNGTNNYLGALGSYYTRLNTFPNGVNSDGTVVGSSRTNLMLPGGEPHYPSFAMHAFTYSGDTMTDLGTLGGTHSSASAINATGTIVGTSDTAAAEHQRAFIYENGRMTDLGAFAGGTSLARDINDAGLIIGQSTHRADSDIQSAFVYANGVMTDLGWSPQRASSAVDINESGQIIGYGVDGYGKQRGFIYQDGQLVELDGLVDPGEQWAIRATYSINDHGVILADACRRNVCGTVILNPVPEPETYALLLAGLGLLGLCARRRARPLSGRGSSYLKGTA